MEVCGGHTHTIYKHGLEDLVPPEIDFVHGPGCPVCVIPMGRVDDAIALAERPEVIFTTFGDMMRVPGGRGSLLEAKARGADVRMVYSPLDALELARRNPEREVIFFAIGFETTAPATAVTAAPRPRRRRPELLGLLQPRHDRAAAEGDPRLAGPAARRVHRARPRLDGGRHAALRLHRPRLRQAGRRHGVRADRHPARDGDARPPAPRGPLRGREPVHARGAPRRQPAGARGARGDDGAARHLRVARPRLDRGQRAQAAARVRGVGRRGPLRAARARGSRIPRPASAARC